MLLDYFDIKIADYSSIDDLVSEEVEQADLVQVRGYVPGGIYHPVQIVWRGDLRKTETPEGFIRSKKEKKAIKGTIQFFEESGYRFSTDPLTEELYEQFLNLYKETTLKRERALSFNLKEQVLGKILSGVPIFMVAMYKGENLESALVFSQNDSKKELVVSYGAKKKFPNIRGGVGGCLEYYLLKFAIEKNIKEISHGTASNPAGLSGKSGIFEFKARYGFSAFPGNYWVTSFIRNKEIALSDLVFVTIESNRLAYLVLTNQSESEHGKRYKTREVDMVIVKSFDDVVAEHKAVLSTFK